MEKMIINAGVGNGDITLPIGFRFRPTDEEVLLHYLIRKKYSLPLPATVIPELDVFNSNPWDLPGDLREKRYFFSKSKSKSSLSSGGCGYWEPTGRDSQIVAPGTNRVIGMKNSSVFNFKHSSGATATATAVVKTQWIMHQYCTITPLLTHQKLEDWVVCCIYQIKQGKRKAKSLGINNPNPTKKCRNLVRMGEVTADSQCSSGITQISCAHDLYQEASSH